MSMLTVGLGVAYAVLTFIAVALVVAGLPGVWMLALVAVLTQALWPGVLGWWVVGGAIAVALLAEAVDFVAGAAGAKAAGGSKSAALGAIIGALVGAVLGTIFIPVPILGTLVGAVVGAGLSAGLVERGVHQKRWADSARVARGAATGRLVAIVVKGALAGVLGVVLTVACFV